MNENISAYVDYNRAFLTIKEMYEKAILELEICNNALRGIAKELGIMNPILLQRIRQLCRKTCGIVGS